MGEWMKRKNGRNVYPEEISEIIKTVPKWIRDTTTDMEWGRLVDLSTVNLNKWQHKRMGKGTIADDSQPLTSIELTRLYLGVVQSSHMYGTSYFAVRFIEPRRWGQYDKLLLGCNWKHVVICDNSYGVLQSIRMKGIKSLIQSSKFNTQIQLKYKDSSDKIITLKFRSLNFKAAFIATQISDLKRDRKLFNRRRKHLLHTQR